jgi:hypothetical protein
MTFRFLLIILLFAVPFTFKVNAQYFMRGVCGVHAHDMELMETLYPNDCKGIEQYDRNNIIHIPIQFHLVATDAGTGRITPNIVLRQLCKLNSDFANTNIRFYLNDLFRNINSTGIYSSPATNGNAIQNRKVARAVNVFITDKADPEGALGTVLGYYSPQGDYVVLTKAEAIKLSNTLSHEMGHFFSLRHTFHGWEQDPWDKAKHSDTIKIRYTLGGTEIEFMNKANCSVAADQLCDTPPDYNFGFTSNGCNYVYDVWDFNREKVIPQKENQMSYFSNCSQFVFTPDQSNRMKINYNSTARNHLKNNPLPNLDTIVGPVNVIQPKQGEQLKVFDGILFDWEDVPNATHYVLEIRNVASNEYHILEKSEFYATNLRKNFQYTYEVTPFSFGHFCTGGTSITFRTGNDSVTSVSDTDSKNKFYVYPNPVSESSPIVVQFETTETMQMDFQMSDMKGTLIHAEKNTFNAGKQHHILQNNALRPGVYFLKIQTENETKVHRIIVH